MAQSPTYCAFEVTVRSASGQPVIGLGISASTNDGRVVGHAVTDENGMARICDSHPGLINVTAGGNLCGSVTVNNLSTLWLKPRPVHITYEQCSGDEYFPAGGCFFILRTINENGNAISGVKLGGRDIEKRTRYEQTNASDALGRIFRFANYDASVSGLLNAPGYGSQTVDLVCRRGDPLDREVTIVLKHL